jgi:hypothetical protein
MLNEDVISSDSRVNPAIPEKVLEVILRTVLARSCKKHHRCEDGDDSLISRDHTAHYSEFG